MPPTEKSPYQMLADFCDTYGLTTTLVRVEQSIRKDERQVLIASIRARLAVVGPNTAVSMQYVRKVLKEVEDQ